MTRFHDGPASDYTLDLDGAPLLLRVVIDPDKGSLAALDQEADEPEKDELVFAYVRCREPFCGFIDWHDGDGRRGGVFVNAEYRLLHRQPDEHTLRHNDNWRTFSEDFAKFGELV